MILQMTRPVQGGLRQERKLEATSNHLANADTTGFKKDVVSFDKIFKAKLNTDFSQGTLKINEEIPPSLYIAVAELLAFVYSLNSRKK